MSSIHIIQGKKAAVLEAEAGENLLELLRKNGFYPDSPCGGNGRCGKCRVELVKDGDSRFVLSCRSELEGDCTVIVPERGSGGEILTEGSSQELRLSPRPGLGAAVDIGTTTVALRLFDLSCGKELGRKSAWNAQGPYGASGQA